MCLAVPARITAIDTASAMAIVALGAITKEISLALVDDLSPGDYVLVHVGYALSRISPEEAERTLALMAEVAQFAEPPTSAVPQGGEGAP